MIILTRYNIYALLHVIRSTCVTEMDVFQPTGAENIYRFRITVSGCNSVCSLLLIPQYGRKEIRSFKYSVRIQENISIMAWQKPALKQFNTTDFMFRYELLLSRHIVMRELVTTAGKLVSPKVIIINDISYRNNRFRGPLSKIHTGMYTSRCYA